MAKLTKSDNGKQIQPKSGIQNFGGSTNIDIIPHSFYVVAPDMYEDGNWIQVTNAFEDYEKATQYKNDDFCKTRFPNAFIVATLKEFPKL